VERSVPLLERYLPSAEGSEEREAHLPAGEVAQESTWREKEM